MKQPGVTQQEFLKLVSVFREITAVYSLPDTSHSHVCTIHMRRGDVGSA